MPTLKSLIGAGIARRSFLARILGAVGLGATALAGIAGKAQAADPPNLVPSPRLGLCVADLQKTIDFYCKALDFKEVVSRQAIGNALGKAMQTDTPLDVGFVQRAGLAIELLHFAAHKRAAPHPMDQPGLTNLTILVEDFEKTLALVPKFGGKIIEATRTKFGVPGNGANIVFVEDPDGVRIGVEVLL